ncbi:ATP-binding protein [Sphingomonas cannabina]|uniref:sensor histidine kinase n=1 Tax=Sphingomonas cannabina TaxID=2899123 RepID=UPI001F28BBE9|nr:ATP-binding protein [Sphingomonas cannabina]UIJ45539.1 ATP-binding protein [Sphingomonas cannabina]
MKLFQASGPVDAEILPPIDERGELSTIAAASVVHDLGNLIQIASSAINIIARTPDMPAVHAGPMLDRARSCLEHAGSLVRQNLGRLRDREAGDERTGLAACLSDVAALVEAMGEPGLILDIGAEPGVPDARCDSLGLRRALLNLVLNARDAMGGKGIVLVRVQVIAPGGVELRVTDHGIGMSRDTIARVFDPRFTTKKDGLGGIGLPMVERFVRAAGGSVSIDSTPGIGTTVTLRLPAIAQPKPHVEESRR